MLLEDGGEGPPDGSARQGLDTVVPLRIHTDSLTLLICPSSDPADICSKYFLTLACDTSVLVNEDPSFTPMRMPTPSVSSMTEIGGTHTPRCRRLSCAGLCEWPHSENECAVSVFPTGNMPEDSQIIEHSIDDLQSPTPSTSSSSANAVETPCRRVAQGALESRNRYGDLTNIQEPRNPAATAQAAAVSARFNKSSPHLSIGETLISGASAVSVDATSPSSRNTAPPIEGSANTSVSDIDRVASVATLTMDRNHPVADVELANAKRCRRVICDGSCGAQHVQGIGSPDFIGSDPPAATFHPFVLSARKHQRNASVSTLDLDGPAPFSPSPGSPALDTSSVSTLDLCLTPSTPSTPSAELDGSPQQRFPAPAAAVLQPVPLSPGSTATSIEPDGQVRGSSPAQAKSPAQRGEQAAAQPLKPTQADEPPEPLDHDQTGPAEEPESIPDPSPADVASQPAETAQPAEPVEAASSVSSVEPAEPAAPAQPASPNSQAQPSPHPALDREARQRLREKLESLLPLGFNREVGCDSPPERERQRRSSPAYSRVVVLYAVLGLAFIIHRSRNQVNRNSGTGDGVHPPSLE